MEKTDKYYKGKIDITTYKGNCAGMSIAIGWKRMKIDERRDIKEHGVIVDSRKHAVEIPHKTV
jgi:hypothetical protein